MARLAERKGWVFPRFSEDDVIQHCVEEALATRVDVLNAREAEAKYRRDAVKAAQARAEANLRSHRG